MSAADDLDQNTSDQNAPGKAWGGRFSEPTDAALEAFTESISFDARLAPQDIAGSKAHAAMLADVGLIGEGERDAIHRELDAIGEQIAAGQMPFRNELEDIHMHIESELIARLGDAGRKLHTGRSRNDQVSTDLHLWTREAIDTIDALLENVQRAFVGRCGQDADVILPAYTHLQRAQPVMACHYWLAYCEKFDRDRGRLADARRRVNVSPLGCAALAGTSLPIDREQTAHALGFDGVRANSLDVSSDRDFLIEFCSALALVAAHLATWAEEWIVWNTTEFAALTLPDRYTTGSSIMPQKRNPDVLELIRGKSARVMATVPQLLTLVKGLPMAYNRDLQEDKLAAFDAFDTVAACLELTASIVRHARLSREAIAARIEEGYLDATALMEWLIKDGVPMRTGHEIVGNLVALAEREGKTLAQLSLDQLRTAHPDISESVYDVLGTENAVGVLASYGSGGRGPVAEQVAIWRERFGM